ncbi:glycosyltransferase family 2 protein [Nocardia gamkensis]|uniref:Glycosyltransferase n=1 Tax=Nocardia gamkensis TaxID=352869 RepID=A0A7X6L5K2_9NOCA|nr:glycosyltransferase family A protein [Nocardia gamkensis]NKY28258.1 glycosyltransferase [Nocardia gamkensis]
MISVVIPTLNRPEFLRQALQSVRQQTYRDVEVIVVNDGGVSVADVVAQWEHDLAVELVELPHRSGCSRARNAGIERASGEYIAFLDDDDIFLPHHLEYAMAMLRSGAQFSYSGAVVSNQRCIEVSPDGARMHQKSYSFDPRFLLIANYIHTGAVVVENFKDTKVRFDEGLSLCEDWDIWLRLTRELALRVSFGADITTIYHQIDGEGGMVVDGQATVPSPFSVVRQSLYSRWQVGDDPLVVRYRDWFTAFESYRNEMIARAAPMPRQLFDAVLRYSYWRFAEGHEPDHSDIPHLFTLPNHSIGQLA